MPSGPTQPFPRTPRCVNRTYLSKPEKGASYPGLKIIAKLANVLEVEPAELLRVAGTSAS
jgi:transcriptional regulator with XRE-family HTH domain